MTVSDRVLGDESGGRRRSLSTLCGCNSKRTAIAKLRLASKRTYTQTHIGPKSRRRIKQNHPGCSTCVFGENSFNNSAHLPSSLGRQSVCEKELLCNQSRVLVQCVSVSPFGVLVCLYSHIHKKTHTQPAHW